ncbi:Zinc finger, CCHC-type [Sesbania bispinosa]|nr:Zinc finger, CCHC-type [Sesbania bispinosa]
MERDSPRESDDQLQRSTKKVKTRGDGSAFSYKDSLLEMPGAEDSCPEFDDEAEFSEEDLSEKKWYKQIEDDQSEPYEYCPEIRVTKQEFDEWCKPWLDSLVVRLLGKKISLQTMVTRLQKYWARDGTIKVMGHVLHLEYEGLHLICFRCGKYGHKRENCYEPVEFPSFGVQTECMDTDNNGQNINAPKDESSNGNHAEVQASLPLAPAPTKSQAPPEFENKEPVDRYGPWMMVKRPQRKFQSQEQFGSVKGKGIQNHGVVGSRFSILEETQPTLDKTPQDEPQSADPIPITQPTTSNVVSREPIIVKVRNKSGGKNPQSGFSRKKEKKISSKPLAISAVAQDSSKKSQKTTSIVPPVKSVSVQPSPRKDQPSKNEELIAQEKEISLMKHYSNQARDEFPFFSVVLPDSDTINFLARQKERISEYGSSKEPPDPGPALDLGAEVNGELKEDQVTHQWPKIQNNISWRINSGRNVSFWKDNWIPFYDILLNIVDPSMVDNVSAKVPDYVDEDGNWDAQRLSGVLPPEALNKILPLLPSNLDRGNDVVAWNGVLDGSFTVASAYNSIVGI